MKAPATTWRNLLPGWLDEELDAAADLGVQRTTPGTSDFDEIIHEGTCRIKWVVTTAGELFAIPFERNCVELAHTVASQGAAVLAAGEAGATGAYFGIEITNRSGHYQPDEASLQIAREAFRKAGIEFVAGGAP